MTEDVQYSAWRTQVGVWSCCQRSAQDGPPEQQPCPCWSKVSEACPLTPDHLPLPLDPAASISAWKPHGHMLRAIRSMQARLDSDTFHVLQGKGAQGCASN